jgi:GntR family transcriptional regulator, transcriptional repressor for pyruvate dehydrogenase complex
MDWRHNNQDNFPRTVSEGRYIKYVSATQLMATDFSTDSDKGDLTDWLILRFKQLISEGALTPGYKLPSERELSLTFGVSRTSLRPVMKVLKMMGVISQRVGDGTYLSSDASAVLAEPMEFLFLLDETSSQELIETRLIVEPTLAAKAAERATPEHLLVLRQTIAEIEAAQSDQFRIIEADLLFHRTILQCSGNRLFGRLFQVIHRSLINMMMLTSQLVDRDHTLAFHQAIFESIRLRNAGDAERHMREHLIDARALLLQAQQKEATERLRKSIGQHNGAKQPALRRSSKK